MAKGPKPGTPSPLKGRPSPLKGRPSPLKGRPSPLKGRPSGKKGIKKAETPRDKVFRLRCTDDDRRVIAEMAKAMGVTQSEYVRFAVHWARGLRV